VFSDDAAACSARAWHTNDPLTQIDHNLSSRELKSAAFLSFLFSWSQQMAQGALRGRGGAEGGGGEEKEEEEEEEDLEEEEMVEEDYRVCTADARLQRQRQAMLKTSWST
jgi:hypothetical protein